MKRSPSRSALAGLIVAVLHLLAAMPTQAQQVDATDGLPFTDPYVFVDRFTNSPDVEALGFPVGPKPFLNVGMIVEKEEAEKAGNPIDIISASATNGEVTFDLVYADIGVLELWDNFDNPPVFDPDKHKGEWVITTVNSEGKTATTQPVLLEHAFEMPFVEDMNAEKLASGDLKVTWSAPKLSQEIQEKCDIKYRVRLLTNSGKQWFRSDPTAETSVSVPADTLKEKVGENLSGTWARVEMACRDRDE